VEAATQRDFSQVLAISEKEMSEGIIMWFNGLRA
jgi:hypothetical protein